MAEFARRTAVLQWILVVAALATLAVQTGVGMQSPGILPGPPCQDDDFEDDDEACWQSHHVAVGSVESRRLCDPDWFELDVLEGATYVIETRHLVGGADTVLELWSMSGTNSCWTYGLPTMSDDDGGEGGGSRLEWTAPYSTWRLPRAVRSQAVVTGKEYGDGMGYDLSIECVADCPPEKEILVVPWVERGEGAGGGPLRTELRLHNPWDVEVEAELELHAADGPWLARLVIAARGEVRVDDVVGDLFGLDAAAGPLEIRIPEHQLLGTARVSEGLPGGGRIGHFMSATPLEKTPVIRGSYGLRHWAHFEMGGLEGPQHLAARFGLYEVIGRPTAVEMTLLAADGTVIGERALDIEANGSFFTEDVFGYFGVAPSDGAGLEVLGTGTGRLLGHAVLRDRSSMDTIAVQGETLERHRLVPVVASVDGAFGTRWTSDLVLAALPAWGQGLEVELTFLPMDGWNTGLTPEALTLRPGESRTLEDVVSWLGASGSGALSIETYSVATWTRVTNHGADRRLGQFVPSMSPGSALRLGDGTLVALGVESSDQVRTNVGWVTATADTGTLELRLVDAADTVLGSRTYPLKPNSPHQVNDVFAWLGVPPQRDCRVELEVVGGRAAILGYASVIDNLSGDAVFVPAAHVPRRGLEPVSLSNRDDCVLVDQLPGAQGLDLLPPGLFRAELRGQAFVGPGWFDDLIPVCLYRDVYGHLEAARLARYYPVDGIAGDAPFWCLAPDWRTREDNSGQVQIVLSNGVDDDIVLTLDARLDAVLVDQLPEAVTIGTTHPRYHLTTTGNLGRPGLEPHTLILYGARWQESVANVVAGHGFWVEGVSVTEPVVAVVLDWIRADDNTGESVLTPAREH